MLRAMDSHPDSRPDSGEVAVAAFYRFVVLNDVAGLRERLRETCAAHGVKGSVLLAEEGINGTLAGPPSGMAAVLGWLRGIAGLEALRHKASFADVMPFHRLKVEIKPEIVTFRQPGIDPTVRVGTHIKAADWNALIDDPTVTVVDTRNDFEVQLGTFVGAHNPHTTSFTEFAAWVDEHLDPARDRKVAMFCTGGIRCEKATAYLLNKGFEGVFHLDGGILQYLEDVPATDSRWQGECFVFDQRVSVGHGLVPGRNLVCHACYKPVDEAALSSSQYEVGVSCPRCFGSADEAKLSSRRERQRQVVLAERRRQPHIGGSMPAKRG